MQHDGLAVSPVRDLKRDVSRSRPRRRCPIPVSRIPLMRPHAGHDRSPHLSVHVYGLARRAAPAAQSPGTSPVKPARAATTGMDGAALNHSDRSRASTHKPLSAIGGREVRSIAGSPGPSRGTGIRAPGVLLSPCFWKLHSISRVFSRDRGYSPISSSHPISPPWSSILPGVRTGCRGEIRFDEPSHLAGLEEVPGDSAEHTYAGPSHSWR